jgi:hypothetical protein
MSNEQTAFQAMVPDESKDQLLADLRKRKEQFEDNMQTIEVHLEVGRENIGLLIAEIEEMEEE